MLRLILWFLIFHVGIDFWLFPNYFCDSNNPLDSFVPFLEVEKREDIFDFRMIIVRIASAAAIAYGANEWLKSDKSMDDVVNVFGDLSNDVFEWGQNKFLGIPDNTQALQHKKSAREIFAEAFMEDDMAFGRSNTYYANYADEEEVKAAYEKEKAEKAKAEAMGEEPSEVVLGEEEEIDLLDSLTKADEDEDASDAKEAVDGAYDQTQESAPVEEAREPDVTPEAVAIETP